MSKVIINVLFVTCVLLPLEIVGSSSAPNKEPLKILVAQQTFKRKSLIRNGSDSPITDESSQSSSMSMQLYPKDPKNLPLRYVISNSEKKQFACEPKIEKEGAPSIKIAEHQESGDDAAAKSKCCGCLR